MVNQSIILNNLRKEILALGGIKSPTIKLAQKHGLYMLKDNFPLGIFPTASMHEFITNNPSQLGASTGFVAATIATCLPDNAIIIWISNAHQVYPAALSMFGIQPHKIIFVHPTNEKETNWCIEQALQCNSITAMVAEMSNLNFYNSRRFQLAVEKSKVTGFVLNTQTNKINTTACVTRWKIESLPSALQNNMPGVGLPRWKVDLQKIRNGKTGHWEMEWANKKFQLVNQPAIVKESFQQSKTG
jgi:protein ImuA